MTYYHPTKQAALDAAAQYEGHWHVAAELVSYNGWVIVLRPRSLEVLNWPLIGLLDLVEVEFPKRLRKRPADHRAAPALAKAAPPPPRPVTPPPRPPAPPSVAPPPAPPQRSVQS